MLPRCDDCGVVIWYPRGALPGLRAAPTSSWFEASGKGTVYSFTVIRRGAGPLREAGAVRLAYVELDEGPRVMTNIVDARHRLVGDRQPVRGRGTTPAKATRSSASAQPATSLVASVRM